MSPLPEQNQTSASSRSEIELKLIELIDQVRRDSSKVWEVLKDKPSSEQITHIYGGMTTGFSSSGKEPAFQDLQARWIGRVIGVACIIRAMEGTAMVDAIDQSADRFQKDMLEQMTKHKDVIDPLIAIFDLVKSIKGDHNV